MDDEIIDGYSAMKSHSEAKRARNRQQSAQALVDKGIAFTSHNAGAHLIVAGRWNFWPGTGKWMERQARPGCSKREGRGVFKLIGELRKDGAA